MQRNLPGDDKGEQWANSGRENKNPRPGGVEQLAVDGRVRGEAASQFS